MGKSADNFFEKVYAIARQIPYGKVTSYGAIAKAVGFPNHSRQVGNALRNYAEDFPAHRVCNSSGFITASCLEEFKIKLEKEGIKVIEIKFKILKIFSGILWKSCDA